VAAQDFIQQLKELGYEVEDRGDGKVAFPYKVPVGRFTDKLIVLGFIVPSDFPLTPPSGPHVSPCLVTPDGSSQHPAGGVQNKSPFGAGWQYWSRPCPGWSRTARDARAYMAYIRKLFDTQ
jgi:Prokaryotic E2 family E